MAKPGKKKSEYVRKEENRVTFRCNPRIWKEAGEILDGTGITRGKYCEMMLRSLVQSKRLSIKDLMGNVVEGLFDASILGSGKIEGKTVKKK